MYRNRLKDLREDRDLKQATLAEYLQVHQTTYSDYELGKLNIPINVLHKLADYYGTSIDYLLAAQARRSPIRRNDIRKSIERIVLRYACMGDVSCV